MQKCLPHSVCGDSKHSGARQEFVLAIIWHSCDNPCWLQVCGQPKHVYLEMNLKSSATGNAHNAGWMQRGGKRRPAIEMPFKAKGVVRKILHRGLGANSGVNGLKDFLKYAHFDIEKHWPRSALLFGLYPRPAAIHFSCNAKKTTEQSCIPQTRCQSTSCEPSVPEALNAQNQTSLHFS